MVRSHGTTGVHTRISHTKKTEHVGGCCAAALTLRDNDAGFAARVVTLWDVASLMLVWRGSLRILIAIEW